MERVYETRSMDNLGRINIPVDIRRDMGLEENSKVELYYDSKNKIFSIKNPNKKKQFSDGLNFLKDLSNYLDKSKKEKISKLIENIKNIFIEGDGL